MKKGKQNYNYEIVLKVKVFNTANYSYVMEKLRELMDDDNYMHTHSKLKVTPKEE